MFSYSRTKSISFFRFHIVFNLFQKPEAWLIVTYIKKQNIVQITFRGKRKPEELAVGDLSMKPSQQDHHMGKYYNQ